MQTGILNLMPKKTPLLLFSVGLCLGAGIIGSFFTVSAIPNWYATLNKPSFSPPNWIFGPVWTVLYIMMGVSLYLIWAKKKIPAVFWVQLILNALWSVIFFGLKNPLLAMVNILALWIAIVLTIKSFYKINKLAGNLLIPYILWVSFATFLNYNIWILNK